MLAWTKYFFMLKTCQFYFLINTLQREIFTCGQLSRFDNFNFLRRKTFANCECNITKLINTRLFTGIFSWLLQKSRNTRKFSVRENFPVYSSTCFSSCFWCLLICLLATCLFQNVSKSTGTLARCVKTLVSLGLV